MQLGKKKLRSSQRTAQTAVSEPSEKRRKRLDASDASHVAEAHDAVDIEDTACFSRQEVAQVMPTCSLFSLCDTSDCACVVFVMPMHRVCWHIIIDVMLSLMLACVRSGRACLPGMTNTTACCPGGGTSSPCGSQRPMTSTKVLRWRPLSNNLHTMSGSVKLCHSKHKSQGLLSTSHAGSTNGQLFRWACNAACKSNALSAT